MFFLTLTAATWDTKFMEACFETDLADSYTVSVELKNYATRNVAGASYVNARYI